MSVLVLDIGSSGLKAAVFDTAGALVALKAAQYASVAPHRQDPATWWTAAITAVRALAPTGLEAIALSGTMENLIALDADGEAVMPAILYSDACGAPALAERTGMLEAMGADAILANTPEPLMSAFKALWFRQAHPDLYARTRHLLPGAKDALALRLTGRAVTDPTTATTMGLMDFAARDWSSALLAQLELDGDKLPPILPATETVGPLTAAAAQALELPEGLPVINGAGDGGTTTVGGGATGAGDVSLYLGTTGWVASVLDREQPEDPGRFFRLAHPLAPEAIAITPILSAGAAANWARTALGLDAAQAEAEARTADSDPEDVLFLPYLNGERFPFLDLNVRAGFVGLSETTGPGDLYRAVLEGVALAIDANLEAVGGGAGHVSLVGGGAASALWPQLIADITQRPVTVPADPVSASARGAFVIAQAALGRGPEDATPSAVFAPRPERAERSARLRTAFGHATQALRSLVPGR